MANTEALNFIHELQALKKMSRKDWRFRVDQNLQFYTREYILEENITKYSYQLRRGANGLPNAIIAPGFEEDGDVLNCYKKGKGIRAEAECVGFQKLEDRIFQGEEEGNFFVWVSPPGSPDQGFKSHSFTFIGHILDDKVDVVAYKNWLTAKDNAKKLNPFIEKEEKFSGKSTDIDFLKAPVFLPGGEWFKSYQDIIRYLDPKRGDFDRASNRWLLGELKPFREAIIQALEQEDKAAADTIRIAHDNYAVALLTGTDQGKGDIMYWAAQPAITLRGSCGFSGGSGVFGGEMFIPMTWFGVEGSYFNCPKCDGKIESGKGITVCPHCGARKEDYGNCG